MFDTIIMALDLFGTVIFAITGAVRGVREKLDFFGVLVLACAVGVGGGVMRDCIIGRTPAAAFTSSSYLICCIVPGVIIFLCNPRLLEKWNLILIGDAIGLGVFTVLGAAKGMECHLVPIGVILSGVITAVGGGVLRDVMVGRIPLVLKSDFYATASLLGGILFCTLMYFRIGYPVAFCATAVFVILLRLWAVSFKIHLPVAK